MKTTDRKLAKRLYKEGNTYRDIASRLGCSVETARQAVLWMPPKRCDIHGRNIVDACPFCELEKDYAGEIKGKSFDDLLNLAKKLSVRSRTKDLVLKRKILIREINNHYKVPPRVIGEAMGRERTTIMFHAKGRH